MQLRVYLAFLISLSSPAGVKNVSLCWRGFTQPQQGAERQGIVSCTWIHGNPRSSTAVGFQAVRYCLSRLKAFLMVVLSDAGCVTVRA